MDSVSWEHSPFIAGRVCLAILNMSRAVNFYRDVLGFKLLRNRGDDNTALAELQGGPSGIRIWLFKGEFLGKACETNPGSMPSLIVLVDTDIETRVNELRAKKVRILQEVEQDPIGKVAQILDSEGNTLEIRQLSDAYRTSIARAESASL